VPLTTAATELFATSTPVVQAPMDAVAGGELAAAVSRAGGLGMIGGGYGDRAWLTEQFARADGARIGCGFITWSLREQPELLDLALEHRPAAVMLGFDDPTDFAGTVRDAGPLLLCQVHNRQQAERALDAGADALVAQGTEAGGHGYGTRTTMTLVPELADLLDHRGSSAVLLAAGGIADGRGLAAALVLGAHGALLGSRFYTTTEALSTPEARGEVVRAGGNTVRTRTYDLVRDRHWPDGHTINVLGNDFVDRWHGNESDLLEHLDQARSQYRRAVADRDYRTANVTIGQAAGIINTVTPAADVVTAITEQARALLGR
jgi:nitronate monooxygenase